MDNCQHPNVHLDTHPNIIALITIIFETSDTELLDIFTFFASFLSSLTEFFAAFVLQQLNSKYSRWQTI